MIFTQEQIERLPGSLVELRDGREGRLSAAPAPRLLPTYYRLLDTANGRVFANICEYAYRSPVDIVEVLEWADEQKPPLCLSPPHELQTEIVARMAGTTIGTGE